MENQTTNIEEVLNQEAILKLELDLILPCMASELKTKLTQTDIEILANLYFEGLICLDWNENDVQEVRFTLIGKLDVFKVKYADEILCFKNHLKMYGYDCNSVEINGFLLYQDLSKSANELLTFDNFEKYWTVYDQYFKNKH